MNFHFSQCRSLKTRVTLFTLAIFVLGLWSLTFYGSHILRADMERVLGEQQYSTVSFIAKEINEELENRLNALQSVAEGISPTVLSDAASVQLLLAQRPVLRALFNDGVTAYRLNDVNDMAADTVAAALQDGKSTIGRPVMGTTLMAPIFGMTVPIRDPQGKVIGALTGVTNMGLPNFLDKVTNSNFGTSGTYLLAAPQHKLFITSSDQSRVMRPLPAAGVNPLNDRFVGGYEGYGVLVNFRGEEELAAAKRIPVAGWFMAIALPTSEAFAPIRVMQWRMLMATLILTLLAGGLTWWMLRRQLSPMLGAIETLAKLSTSHGPLRPLPIARKDEIGALIGSFNHLIETLAQRESELQGSEAFKQAILNSVAAEIVVLDRDGLILATNEPWRRFALENGTMAGTPAQGCEVGTNYLSVCQPRSGFPTDEAGDAGVGIRAVLDGNLNHFSLEYPCHSPHEDRWFSMNVTPMGNAGHGPIVITHTNITERKRTEAQLNKALQQAQEAERILHALMEHVPEGITIANAPDVTIRMVSRYGCELVGKPKAALEGIPVSEHAETWGIYCADGVTPAQNDDLPLTRATQKGELVEDEEWVLSNASGKRIPILCNAAPIKDEQGQVTGGVMAWRDMTDLKAQQTQLQLAAQVFAQSKEGITITDAQGNIIMVNRAFTEITGYAEAEVLGQNPRIISSNRQGPEFYAGMWSDILDKGHWAGEIWNRRKDGTVYPEWLSITAMNDADAQVSHYIGNFSDLSDAKATESRIQWMSHYDVLTGLPNRTLLEDRTDHTLALAQRAHEPASMMMLSIDHFKNVNETLGHHSADDLLVEIAKRLSETVRAQDTVARLGGKEFVLVLADTSAVGAAHLASVLLRKLAEPFRTADQELALTASIGIATYPAHGQDFESLFKSVEIAVHRAQVNGRNAFAFYTDDMYQQVQARDQMTKALRTAAAQDQLQLVYQPLVDLQSGQISGLEALLRWHHPKLGTISPAQFIPLAEESGLIKDIGEWVLRQTCRDIRNWLNKGIQVPHVAINVSPLQFRDTDLLAQVKSTLAEFQVDPAMVYLEVTEGALMDDVPRSEAMLRSLKEMGLKLSLDDFGTGYSSLSYLKRFPFDKVKIDQSFVRDITTSHSDNVIVKVIVSMAHGLGLKVIAEGVETEAQCEIMRASVCDEIQGYFFSKPISALAIEELFTEGRQLPAHLLRLQKPQRTLLLVDDEPHIVSSLKRLFRRDGHVILTAGSGAEGLDVLSKHKVDIIISDQRMPGMTGVEFLRAAKVNYPDTIRIVLSGYTELQSVTDAINEGAIYRFLTKPWDDESLREHVKKAFEYKELLEENRQLDIKIRTTNQELMAANRQLGHVLQNTRHQIQRDETSLAIVREALQHIPLPVIGVDDEGLMAFVNAAAEQLFANAGPLLGVELVYGLPALHAAMADANEGVPFKILIDHHAYVAQWNTMGVNSQSRGKLLTLTRNDSNS